MKINGLNAWMLHKQLKGESSAYVTFFTKEHGIVNINVKGIRSAKKPLLLQAFVPLWIIPNRTFNFANKIEVNGQMLSLASESLFAGLYINELIYYALKPLDCHEELFVQYEQTLQRLDANLTRPEISLILRHFEIALLKQCGYELNLFEDVNGDPIDSAKYYSFFPEEGFKVTYSGFKGEMILAFAQNNFTDPKVLQIAKIITRAAIDFALDGRNIKARSLYFSGV